MDGDPITDNTGAAPGESKISMEFVQLGRQGKVQLVAHGKGWTFADKLDATDAEGRAKFLKALLDKHADVTEADAAPELDRIAAEVAQDVLDGKADGKEELSEDEADGGDNEVLVQIVTKLRPVTLFHVGARHDAVAYATIEFEGHRENWPILSSGFRFWLRQEFYKLCGRPPIAQGFTDAINVIESLAIMDGGEDRVFLRLAGHDGDIYLDLGDATWGAIRITKHGWSFVDSMKVPVRFIRRRGMQELPMPTRGGSIDELRPFVNCPSDDLWVLYAGSLPSLFRPRGPYVVLAFSGEQGAAKSSTVKKTRALVDPNVAPTRRLTRDDRDLMIAANNAFVLAFDNLSTISPSMSDALCSLATGGGFGTRQLYSDDEEKLIDAMRPVLLNGIEDVATRADILDRAVVLSLPPIPEGKRREELDLDAAFERARPRILGALLDAVSTAMRRFDSVILKRKPRMIDFARWCTAAETSFGWREGTFLDAYMRNRGDAVSIAIEASAVGTPILTFMASQAVWQGTPTEFLVALENVADQRTKERKDWPKTGKGMTDALKRLAPALRTLGIDSKIGDRKPGGNRDRQIKLWKIAPDEGGGEGQSRDGSGPDNRPYENGPGSAPDGFRDGWDGRDSRVPTDQEDGSKEPTSGQHRREADQTETTTPVSGEAGTQPSQASQPSRPPIPGPEKADSPGRLRDGSIEGGTVDPDDECPSDRYEIDPDGQAEMFPRPREWED